MKEAERKLQLEKEKTERNENTRQMLEIMKEMLISNNTEINKENLKKNEAYIRKIIEMEKELA